MVVPEFKGDPTKKIAASDAELKEMQKEEIAGAADLDAKAAELRAKLPPPDSFGAWRASPAEFEKDDDTNYHVDFITACSNLRARNYKIKEVREDGLTDGLTYWFTD